MKAACSVVVGGLFGTFVRGLYRKRQKLAAHPGNRLFKETRPDPSTKVTRTIASGKIQGFQATSTNSERLHFRGIPYAKPLIGRMALLPPEPPHHWEDPLDCCNFGSAVPQSDPSASTLTLFGIPSNTELNYGSIGDDCLNLNVSTPVLHSEEDDAVLLQNPTLPSPLPVIVWIHGGANKQGSNAEGGFLVDSVAFGEEKVVTVSVNYRLGLLGFGHLTSSEHNNESQNLALKDLHLALEWVQANISTFGGNPNNVTLLGESAGAVNIAGLLASPYAPNRLFHRAVLSSGGPNDLPIDVYDQHVKPGLFTMNVDGNNVKSEVDGVLSQSLGEPTPLLLEGLEYGETGGVGLTSSDYQRTQSQDHLLDKHGVGMSPALFCHVSGVGGHNDVLPHPILDAVKHGSAKGVPLLIGHNSDEFPGFFRLLLRSKGLPESFANAAVREIFKRGGVGSISTKAMLRHALGNQVVGDGALDDAACNEKLSVLRDKIATKYPNEDEHGVTRILVNTLASASSNLLARAQASTGADVFSYEIHLDSVDSPLGGNFHGLDLILLFGRKLYFEEKEWAMLCEHFVGSNDLTENFVRTGRVWRKGIVHFATHGTPGQAWSKSIGQDGIGDTTVLGSNGTFGVDSFGDVVVE